MVTSGGLPIAGAFVYLPGRDYTVITGSGGTFQMDQVPAGTYTVIVVVNGVLRATANNIIVGNSGTTNAGNIIY